MATKGAAIVGLVMGHEWERFSKCYVSNLKLWFREENDGVVQCVWRGEGGGGGERERESGPRARGAARGAEGLGEQAGVPCSPCRARVTALHFVPRSPVVGRVVQVTDLPNRGARRGDRSAAERLAGGEDVLGGGIVEQLKFCSEVNSFVSRWHRGPTPRHEPRAVSYISVNRYSHPSVPIPLHPRATDPCSFQTGHPLPLATPPHPPLAFRQLSHPEASGRPIPHDQRHWRVARSSRATPSVS